ncbi:MAG: DUF2589 domain-containing protein [Saccharospirillaceae bacterium]|nr:DUF2589 domain-containing protein [Pseudomonadales bacterium]NRB80825.1 DUF2589 domain-containing protein [Saccharospirillaceae bacterium]
MVDKNNKLVSMAHQFSGLPIKELIAAPLVAAAKANNMMAMTQTNFIMENCFNNSIKGDKEIFSPIMIGMTITRSVLNKDGTPAKSIETDFEIPLLSIIPLNSLAVDEVNVSFEMEVKSSFERRSTKNSENTIADKIKSSTTMSEITGSVAASDKSNDSSTFKKSNSAKYEISTHAGQIPLPGGLLTVLKMYDQAMSPIQLKDNQ